MYLLNGLFISFFVFNESDVDGQSLDSFRFKEKQSNNLCFYLKMKLCTSLWNFVCLECFVEITAGTIVSFTYPFLLTANLMRFFFLLNSEGILSKGGFSHRI